MSENKQNELSFIKSKEINSLLNEEINLDFKEALIDMMIMLNKRCFLDADKVKEEIFNITDHSINVDDYETDSNDLITYHKIINDLDQSRSRLSELLSDAESDFECVKTAYDTLKNMWIGCYSKQTSDKKREGEADRILFFLIGERIKRKEVFSLVKEKFTLIKNKMDSVSRHITIDLEFRKEYRGCNLEYDYNKEYRAEKKRKTLVKNKDPKAKGWDIFSEN